MSLKKVINPSYIYLVKEMIKKSTSRDHNIRIFAVSIFMALLLILFAENVQAMYTTNETFVGPLNGWRNLQTDYGAVGDGVANDTVALQNALNDLKNSTRENTVLYIPAGTYLFSNMLNFSRESNIGGSILGEDPDNTTLLWNSSSNGTMIKYNPRDFSMGRITLDGNRKAGIILEQTTAFSTRNEFFDMVFKNAEICLNGGNTSATSFGIAEVSVYRSRFSYCSNISIHIANGNSLDWWIWDSRFENNSKGITNLQGQGGFNVYQSVFFNSTSADISIGSTLFFGIRDNWSNRSKKFFDSTGIRSWAGITIQRNTILDSTDNNTIVLGSYGPLLLLDNIIRSNPSFTSGTVVESNQGGAASARGGAIIAINNTFTAQNHYGLTTTTRLLNISDNTINATTLNYPVPVLPGIPERRIPTTYELQPNATFDEIQSRINQASALHGERAVIHFANGTYNINQTLVIPNGSDIQLIGDSYRDITIIKWTGAGGGLMMHIWGPSHARISQIMFDGNKNNATGIVINQSDQAGARLHFDQVYVHNTTGSGLLVNKTQNADIGLYNFLHHSSPVGVKVLGYGPGQTTSKVKMYSGAGGSDLYNYEVDNGGWLLVRDAWYESATTGGGGIVDSTTFANFTGSGTFTLHGGRISHNWDGLQVAVLVDNFNGSVNFIAVQEDTINGTTESLDSPDFQLNGDSPNANFSFIAGVGDGNSTSKFNASYFNVTSSTANAGLIASHVLEPSGVSNLTDDQNKNSTNFLVASLAQTRDIGAVITNHTPNPASITDLELHSVLVSQTTNGIVIQADPVAETTSTSSSSGGTSSGSGCNYVCSEWSDCEHNQQQRTCTGCVQKTETRSCEVCVESWICSDGLHV
jgi:hypothetical protein